ncbi:hypothetical protein [Candidatus Phytoplasma mali]|nr:hypothetical protein [Candidatus Phytoplasma mali]
MFISLFLLEFICVKKKRKPTSTLNKQKTLKTLNTVEWQYFLFS